ncbi:hypothetical protein QJS10_CPB17g00253 [Acorus calamus]|uniref:F-box domain-containing protein n=1 Tax=Acorus calamus TaxID=4465 RepID=A0AAV9CS87_ACOCL|nr:hypothetical protein QJS10_CPB17g00253 [Acorus calamus]
MEEFRCESLPEEIWDSILQRVDEDDFESLSLTCKLFLSITDRLRSTLTVSDRTIAAPGGGISGILRRFRQVRRIKVDPAFRGDLDLVVREISGSGLAIETLDLSRQRVFPSSSVRTFGEKLRKTLKTLICTNLRSMTDRDLLAISEAFPGLEELDISKSHLDTSSAMITDGGIEALASSLAHLRRIDVSGHFITDASLSSLSSRCASLSELHVRDCCFISESAIASAVERRPNTTAISIGGNLTLTRRSFADARFLRTLRVSDSRLSDEFLTSLANSRLPLGDLRFDHCIGLDFESLFSILKTHRSLNRLGLRNAQFLTDESMELLTPLLRELTAIDLGSCVNLTEWTFFRLAENCPRMEEVRMNMTKLGSRFGSGSNSVKKNNRIRFLNLSLDNHLNDATLRGIGAVCPELREVVMRHCWRVSDSGIDELGRICPRIRSLDVYGCGSLKNLGSAGGFGELETLRASASKIGDEGLAMAVQRFGERLRVVELECTVVTEEGVGEMMRRCRRLKEVNLKYCRNICSGGGECFWLARMVFSSPSIRRITLPEHLRSRLTTEKQRELFLRHGCVVR